MKTGIIILVASLAALAQAQDEANIECLYRLENFPPAIGLQTCSVKPTSDNIVTKDTKVVTVNGKATPQTDVKAFSAANVVIKYFPTGLLDRFPGLQTLSLTSTKLAVLTPKDLEPFGDKLLILWINGNDIQVLEQDLFKTNTKLKNLNLSNNKITYLHPEVFTPLKVLSQLFMSRQAIDCRIGDSSTSVAVAAALDNVVFSPCVQASNAPAVFFLLKECQGQRLPDPEEIEAMRSG